jgi:hypothetical protein
MGDMKPFGCKYTRNLLASQIFFGIFFQRGFAVGGGKILSSGRFMVKGIQPTQGTLVLADWRQEHPDRPLLARRYSGEIARQRQRTIGVSIADSGGVGYRSNQLIFNYFWDWHFFGRPLACLVPTSGPLGAILSAANFTAY